MHPDWALLLRSWLLALEADGYSPPTVRTYQTAVRSLAASVPETAPAELERGQVRAWLAGVRRQRSQGTARTWISGVRHFCRWLVEEGEADHDATAGIRTPRPPEPRTRVLTEAELRALLRACDGRDFRARRDAAIVLLFADAGLRLGELAGLTVTDVDATGRIVQVAGKGSRRSGPRRRALPLGARTARALDRYLRERRRHPHADRAALWLGDRGQPTLGRDGIVRALKRRAAAAGIGGSMHPHMLRHTWAHHFRAAGGSEGDLMWLGGWTSRAMLDRYGASTAAERAAEAGRRFSLADRL
jgi:site-specific recombinase XerC